ncbi:hypothetical protein FQA39_LY07563 [Lamprigera yunnana]|nr:hypothetical protein FQA39_LY18837 [Lamprigera yunnana]KAF5273232.1 hypothetical protein FQA39_LY07563 [Lamprigera yunnana]
MQTENTTDGVLYQVIETPEIYKLIVEDAAFAANYINQNKSCLEIIGVDREDEVVANNNAGRDNTTKELFAYEVVNN